MVIIPGRYERVLILRSTSMKVEVSKRPNGLGADAQRIPRVESFLPLHPLQRRARAYQLFIRFKRVDVLLSIADVREPVDVRYEGQPGKHILVLSSSQFDPGCVKTSCLL